MVLIKSINLTKKFRNNVLALSNLNFELEGRIIAIVGPNGSGKSTLLSILAGLRYPTKGRLLLNGFEPYREREETLKRISFTFEKPRFNIGITVQRLLEILIEECPDQSDLVDSIKLFGVNNLGSKKLHELSSGQAQLLALIVALFCNKRKVAILDEPLAHLDIRNKARLINIMNNRGNIVFTTHVIDEAEAIADSAVILNNGASVWYGSLKDMYYKDIFEVFVRRDNLDTFKKLVGREIIADLGSYLLVKVDNRDILDNLMNEGVVLGYRRAGLRVKFYEKLKNRFEAIY